MRGKLSMQRATRQKMGHGKPILTVCPLKGVACHYKKIPFPSKKKTYWNEKPLLLAIEEQDKRMLAALSLNALNKKDRSRYTLGIVVVEVGVKVAAKGDQGN
jgi:hypothetical protein